jgi:uncharacterized membrane protein YqjE
MEIAEEAAPEADDADSNHVDLVRFLHSAGGVIGAQALQYTQLLRVEWAEEKNRLLHMLVLAMLGFSCLLCLFLLSSALVVLFSWNTAYRIHALATLFIIYGMGIYVAYWRFSILSARSNQAFSATREELAADGLAATSTNNQQSTAVSLSTLPLNEQRQLIRQQLQERRQLIAHELELATQTNKFNPKSKTLRFLMKNSLAKVFIEMVLVTAGRRFFKNISTTVAVMQIIKSLFDTEKKDTLI